MLNYLSQTQISSILNLALEAGNIAREAFDKNSFDIFTKSDKSKVSSADIAISKLIESKLSEICPNIPIICEENEVRNIDTDIFFLIDPIDGTSSFINNNCEFCINIALIHNNIPIFGLIYAPLFEGGKAIFSDCENQVILYNNTDKKFSRIQNFDKFKFPPKTLRIITSARTKDNDIDVFIKQFFPNFINNYSVEKLSSAIKFFKIIENQAELYLHFRTSMEWDTASGDALVRMLGLRLKSLDYDSSKFFIGDELQYKKNNFINSKFVVIAF